MAQNRTGPAFFVSDQSGADRYVEDIRYPKYCRMVIKFPLLGYNRRAANMALDYSDSTWHRSFGDCIPGEGIDVTALSTSPPDDFSSSKYAFVSDAPLGSNMPPGTIATSSGCVPYTTPPFTVPEHGQVVNSGVEINPEFDNTSDGTGEYFYAKNVETQAMKDNAGTVPNYIPVTSGMRPTEDHRVGWAIKPEYQSPVYPSLRYPGDGAVKRSPKGSLV